MQMERDIREILGDEVEIVVTPFVFETGNIFFVEAADGETVLVTGKKTAFDNEEYRVRPWAEMLRARGLDVIELPFDGTPKSGGSFRCASLPLYRE